MINANVLDNGHLQFLLDDGTLIDAGNVRGIPGPQGSQGIAGI